MCPEGTWHTSPLHIIVSMPRRVCFVLKESCKTCTTLLSKFVLQLCGRLNTCWFYLDVASLYLSGRQTVWVDGMCGSCIKWLCSSPSITSSTCQ